MTSAQKLVFYATPPHDCNYLPERKAITLFADPKFPKNMQLYSTLADRGFRRSGTHLYIPHCTGCDACISVRIPVDQFKPSRSQKRTWQRNQDVVVKPLAAEFNTEHFALYKKYLAFRHPNGGMDNATEDAYMDFLTAAWSNTLFYEMRVSGKLLAVAVTDVMNDALSAVYTFYDPEESARSPGKFAILSQIRQAQLMGLTWLYLGYWISTCSKMEYKSEFRPQQIFQNNAWHDYIPENRESSLPV